MENDKRYLVFKYDNYYPSGGMNDLVASFDDEQEAIAFAKSGNWDYFDIYDRLEVKAI